MDAKEREFQSGGTKLDTATALHQFVFIRVHSHPFAVESNSYGLVRHEKFHADGCPDLEALAVRRGNSGGLIDRENGNVVRILVGRDQP